MIPTNHDLVFFNNIQQAHRQSAIGAHAQSWLMFGRSVMSSSEFALAMRFRCEIWPTLASKQCTCGFQFVTDALDNYTHALTCTDNVYSYIGRHNEIVRSIQRVVKAAGFDTQVEPTQFHGTHSSHAAATALADAKRPDITVFTHESSPVVDVSVVTNTCRTYLSSDAAGRITKKKNDKHKDNVEKIEGYTFYPLVLESSGAAAPELDTFASHLSRSLPFGSTKHFRQVLIHEVITALQRGNARILKHYFARVMKSAQFGSPIFAA